MLDRFYPIVDNVAWIERLLGLGVRFMQLRIKNRREVAVRESVHRAKVLCERYQACLVINDYWQIAIAAGCDFVHLGQGDLDTADVAAIRRAGIRFGVSTHDRAELERALVYRPDYVALGPIYRTKLKRMPCAPQGLERIGEWKKRIGAMPLVAIGGLTVERLPDVFAAGADSTAVITDIVQHVDPTARVRAWRAATRRLA